MSEETTDKQEDSSSKVCPNCNLVMIVPPYSPSQAICRNCGHTVWITPRKATTGIKRYQGRIV